MATAIHHSVRDGVGWVRLDGAERLNPIGTATYTELADVIRRFEAEGSARAVVIHGAGRVFSAGADIEEISRFADRAQFENYLRGFTDALDVLSTSRLPSVAAVHGAALGGGLELALACDLRLATPTAKLGLPEAKLGVLPGAGGTQRLPRLIPHGVVIEMLMLGTPISGERGHTLGLINRLCDAESLIAEAADVAAQLVSGSGQVAAAAKHLVRAAAGLSLAEGIEQERITTGQLFDSADGREGFAAFIQKRSPAFLS